MPTKSLARICVAVLALALVLTLVPSLNSAAQNPRTRLQLILKQPVLVVAAIFPWLNQNPAAALTSTATQPSTPSTGRRRPTDVLPIERPGGGD